MTLPELAVHQVLAVTQVLETMQRYGGVLLADEPGLGKSYIAAAAASTLSRHGFSVELLVPASLLRQWRRTIDLFELDADARSHDSLIHERSVPDVRRRLVIVDEAHGFRNCRTRRYDALARRSLGARLLLITATPLNNRADDLTALLALIAPDDALLMEGVPSIRRALQENDRLGIDRCVSLLVIRRGREALPPALRFGALDRRVIRHPIPEIPSFHELRFPLLAEGGPRELLRRLMIRRLESSEAALAETVTRQQRFYERALDAMAGGRELTRRDYRELFAAGDERDAMQKVLFWDLFAPAAAVTGPRELEEELSRLDAVRAELEQSPGAKMSLFLDRIAPDTVPALVFTEAVATAQALFAALRHHRRTGLATSRGSWPPGAIDAFSGGRIDVLVATDLVSEGLDLQRAGRVVHYDLPWNPVRIDQRNGRALRIGQHRPTVTAIYFVPERVAWSSGVLPILAAKNRLRRGILDRPRLSDRDEPDPTLSARRLALPRHIPRGAPELALWNAFRSAGLTPPLSLLRPHRAGMERLIGEMAGEYLDQRRLRDLEALLQMETIRSPPPTDF